MRDTEKSQEQSSLDDRSRAWLGEFCNDVAHGRHLVAT